MANYPPKNLYQLKDFFRLTFNGGETYVDEPPGWDKASINGSRDPEYWGFNYDFIDPVINLLFVKGQGLELIQFVDENFGSDGLIRFEYGYEQNGVKLVQYAGNLNLNTLSETVDGLECSIEKIVFDTLLRTRAETKIAMNATVDLDGNPVTPPTPLRIKLHSKKIKKASIGKQQTEIPNPALEGVGTVSAWLILPDTTNVIQSELDTLFAMPLSIGHEGSIAQNLYNDNLYQFEAAEAGTATISFASKFNLVIQKTGGGSAVEIDDYFLRHYIVIRRAGATLSTTTGVAASGHIDAFGATIPIDFTSSIAYNLEAGDVVFFYMLWQSYLTQYKLIFNAYESNVSVTQQTVAEASYCKGYRIYDVLNHIFRCITGKANAISSGLFLDGCGSKYILTNGYQIRNFDIDNKPFTISLKEVLEGVHPIWCIGLQYSTDALGAEIAIIEQLRHFFGANIIYRLRTVYDYKEEHDKSITFNEIKIGYEKFAEGEINSLDEFNTYQEYLTPIKTYKGKYEKRSKFIASGYSIEKIRREQFKKNPSTSVSGDDDAFIIAFTERRLYKDIQFTTSGVPVFGGYISLSKPVDMLVGETFTIDGINSGTIFTVTHNLSDDLVERYRISPNPVTGSGVANLEVFLDSLAAERNEAFDVVTGIYSPGTAYNLRISPKRNLFNHARVLNGCLYLKDDADIIRNTFTKNNGELYTILHHSDPCKMNEENYAFKENANIVLRFFNDRRRLYSAKIVQFKTRLRYDSLLRIKKSLTGKADNPADNYGTISFPDLKKVLWEGVILAISYNPVDEVAQFTVRKKRKI